MAADRDILVYPLFQGDETYVRVLTNKMVTTRRPHTCVICWQVFPAGSRARAQTERNNEECKVATFYCCPLCCAAIALSWTDNGEALTARTRTFPDIAAAAASSSEAASSRSEPCGEVRGAAAITDQQ